MRIVTGSLIFLIVAAHPAAGSEAFIAQLTDKGVLAGQLAGATSTTAQAAAMLALPLQPASLKSPAPTAAGTASNTSSVAQLGTGNLAAVVQIGSGNLSTVVQHGSGNQAVVTQRQSGR